MAIRLIALLLLCASIASAQVVPYPPQNGGLNVCNQGVACKADTLWVNENISCSGSPAVITGMVDNLSLSPYASGAAQAVVTGCGPLSAQNVVQTGITVTAGGTSYAAAVTPVAGDYIVIGGGTPVNGSSFTGSIDHTTGVLTITSMTSGTIYPGTVLTFGGQAATNITFILDFISGTGGAGTYLTTYNSGADLASTTLTGTNNTVLRVLTVSGGAVLTAGVVAGGRYSTAPGAPQDQTGTGGGTSGSGTSATFTLSYIGLPISGQVAAVSWNGSRGGFTFVNGVNSVTTVSNTQEQISIGHPDDAAVSAALTKNPVAVIFPNTVQPTWSRIPLGYGFINQINLPITQRISVLCGGTRIIALGPQNAQMAVANQSNSSLFYKPVLDNCDFQGMGVANYNIYESSAQWQIQNSSLENATVENLFIGDSSKDNANDVVVSNIRIHTDTNAVPSWPLYNYEINASADNKVIGTTMDHAIWGGMYINGADDQVTATHLFAYAAGPCYDIESSKDGLGGICDNQAPGQAAYYMNGSLSQIEDGWMDSVASATLLGRYGVYVNNDARNTIGCGVGDPGLVWNGNQANLVFFGVTQTLTRVAPCTGNGAADPTIYAGPANLSSAGSGAVNILTGASSGVTHINDDTGSGNVQIGNSSSPLTNLGSAQTNLNGSWTGVNSVKLNECGTAPSLGAGFGSTASFSPAFNCSWSFSVTASGTGQTTTTAITALPALQATHKWFCMAIDESSNITGRETGNSTTSFTITWTSAPTANDVIDFICGAI